jgi:hypothetical protein
LRPCFFAAVERKPRTLWACISARVALLGRPICPRIFAPLLSAGGVLASLTWAGLAFLAALASFFGAAGRLPLALFLLLGAPFFWVAPSLEEALSGATCAPRL